MTTRVHLREKKLSNGMLSLYLDYWPALIDPETGKPTRREFLKLYLHAKPKGQNERDSNKECRLRAEKIQAKRQSDILDGIHGFIPSRAKREDFVEHFGKAVEKMHGRSVYNRFNATYQKLQEFAKGPVPFSKINQGFCEGFREFLKDQAGLSARSSSQYFLHFRSIVKKAYQAKRFPSDPLAGLKGIPAKQSDREYLSQAELRTLAAADCPNPTLKRAGLFAALTGLRWGDISRLQWANVRYDEEQGRHLKFTQKKTGEAETLPISDEAAELLGDRGGDNDLVFAGLAKWQVERQLPIWLAHAGIKKRFGFHCFRHTYATLQLANGTDIYTVSRMLGHTSIKTTEIYTRVLDPKKKEAANRISLK